MPLMRRGSLTAPARRNTIAADEGGCVEGEDRLSRSPGGSGFGLDGDGAFVNFDAEADVNYLLEVGGTAQAPARAGARDPVAGTGGELRPWYADDYRGWPVAPRNRQHPVRGSWLDPRRKEEYHPGIDISVRDDRPERGAPPGRTHRVYALEGGPVWRV